MTTPHQIEPNANNALGILLQGMLSSSQVLSENTQVIVGHPGLHPDILITGPGRSPVVVEAEYVPASTAENEAKGRLGLEVTGQQRPIEAAVALRYPENISGADDLHTALNNAHLSYSLFTVAAYDESSAGQTKRIVRFPQSGWLDGSVEDLADLIRLVSVPQSSVDRAARALQTGIDATAAMLEEEGKSRPAVTARIARILGMSNVPQTHRMACAIIANAMVFHGRIAGMHEGIKQLHQVCGEEVANPQEEMLEAWADILKINYWPIFAVARDIIGELSPATATQIMRALQVRVWEMSARGVDNSHDLTGRVFQRLIADRKYLATFYTLPASAALLARLAVAKMEGVDWSNAEAIGKLQIGDFACGTGALLSAVYEQIAARHERAGGDPAELHQVMMEEVLYGCDVMPSAVHITGSTLAGAQPSIGFYESRIYSLPYGRMNEGGVAIGSLEFLNSNAQMTLSNYTNPALQTGSVGPETASQVIADVRDGTFDLVIMNPPFTRNTGMEGGKVGVFNPAFAAFNASDSDQRAMSKRMDSLKKGTCYHGNAGIASAFAALADSKLKPGGVLALVLPLSSAVGLSWESFRQTVARNYTDLTVLSIAAADNDDLSFSADTGMAECLVIARKAVTGEDLKSASNTSRFLSLGSRTQGLVHAAAITKDIMKSGFVRGIEDGPYGGTPLTVGNETVGHVLSAPHSSNGDPWSAVRISDFSLAQTAHAMGRSKLWLPGDSKSHHVQMDALGTVGKLGLYHLDISGPPPRAPFSRSAYSPTATYPCLWNHDAQKETRIVCDPDSQLVVIPGLEQKSASVWSTASRSHLNRDFRFNSQSLAVAVTERASMGGRAWPNAIFPDQRFDFPFALWCNCTLGLLSYWWNANKQQSGRGVTSIRSAETLTILDVRALTNEQLGKAEEIFEEFRDKELKPAYLADADPNRALLDRRVVCDLLGFDEEVYMGVRRLAAKWCAEPSVHGGKARPRGAVLVV